MIQYSKTRVSCDGKDCPAVVEMVVEAVPPRAGALADEGWVADPGTCWHYCPECSGRDQQDSTARASSLEKVALERARAALERILEYLERRAGMWSHTEDQ